MLYEIHKDLKALLKAAAARQGRKITYRELGQALGFSPSVIGQKLNGFLSLTPAEKAKIQQICFNVFTQKEGVLNEKV